MSSRGTALERVVGFFRDSNLDVARVTYQLVEEVMTKRMEEYEAAAKSQGKAAATPRKKRRTKAEIDAAKTPGPVAASVATTA